MPPLLGVTKYNEKNKPAIIKFYDFSKGGTDIIDQQMEMYTTNCKSKCWTMSAFSYILDTMRVNAQTIYSLNNNIQPRKLNLFEFGFQPVKELFQKK